MAEQMEQRNLLRYTTVGLEFAVTVALVTAPGVWLDVKLETAPGFSIVLGLAGFGIGLYRLLKQAQAIRRGSRPPKEAEDDNHRGRA